MKYQIILFIVLFVAIWVMHKPFDVHNTKFNKFHKWLEYVLILLLHVLYLSFEELKVWLN